MRSVNGKIIVHARYLLYLWNKAKMRLGQVYLLKTKAHRKDLEEVSQLNNKADTMAKQVALLRPNVV